jgi:hypothetical protein
MRHLLKDKTHLVKNTKDETTRWVPIIITDAIRAGSKSH